MNSKCGCSRSPLAEVQGNAARALWVEGSEDCCCRFEKQRSSNVLRETCASNANPYQNAKAAARYSDNPELLNMH